MSFFFGQIVPLLINFSHHVGYTLSISTLGSFLGALVPSIILMHYFGVNTTIAFNIFICGSLIFIVSVSKKLRAIAVIVSALGIFINMYFVNKDLVASNEYSDYEVKIHRPSGNKLLSVNKDRYSSLITKDNKFSAKYNDLLHELILFKKEPLNVLVLGAGGFTLSNRNIHHNYVFIDIDPQLKKIIEANFNPGFKGEFIAEDAFSYILRVEEKYDLIMQDIYRAAMQIPARFKTIDFFKMVHNRLNEGGFFAINYAHHRHFQDEETQNYFNTLNKVFPYCYHIPSFLRKNETRVLLICSKTQKKHHGVYTLDKAQ